MSDSGICVFGSLNVDLTVRLERFHKPGETVTGRSFHTFTGGKGGNQAVAAARLGGNVRMFSCVGRDEYAKTYTDALAREGVGTAFVRPVDDSTGVALIEVDDRGENRIAVVPGANGHLTAAGIEKALEGCGYLLLQLETPIEGVQEAARAAHGMGITVILDPAPARPLPDGLLRDCDYLTPNETELETLSGMPCGTAEEAEAACQSLIARGVGAVVNKRGAAGALLVTERGSFLSPGFPVTAVDTTAAGDTFNAGLAVGLSLGMSIEDAMEIANAAGALSVTGMGAQGAMPSFDAVRALIRSGKAEKSEK